MSIATGRISLGIPTELRIARLWWLVSEMSTAEVDFLIEFADDATPGLQAFFGAKTALEHLLGCAIDLIEHGAVRNPYVLASINRNREARVYSVTRVRFCGICASRPWPFRALLLERSRTPTRPATWCKRALSVSWKSLARR